MKEHIQCYDAYAPLPRLQRCIREGHSVLVLMRGVPGSGKSHLAKELFGLRDGGSIFSTDDFFMKSGEYQFKQEMLEEYHKKNILRARDAMKDSVTPVIIDNTNIFATHMKQYICHAVANYYEVYIVEPSTSWCRRAAECARRNVHGVSKERIIKMIDDMDIEQDPPLANLIGKDRQLRLDPTHDEEEMEKEVVEVPNKTTHRAGTSSLFSMGSPLSVATAPAPIFSLAPPTTAPTVIKKMRDVSTGDNEVTITLSAVGFQDMFEENFSAGEEFERERNLAEKVETKDRPSPFSSEAKNFALVEASDLDLLVSIFPTECMATIQHYYQMYGLTGVIKLFCDQRIMPDLEAEVKEGVFSAEIARALQSGSAEPDFVDFPRMGNGADSEAQTSTSDSEYSQPMIEVEEKLYVDLGEALCAQLQHLFGSTAGGNSPTLAIVSKSALKKLYDDWMSSSFADEPMPSPVDDDEAIARRLHEEEVRQMNQKTYAPKPVFTGAQHLQLHALYKDYPGISEEAMRDFYVANGMSAMNTRSMLGDSAFHTPALQSTNMVIQPSAFPNSPTPRGSAGQKQPAKILPGGRVMRTDFEDAHRRVGYLLEEMDDIRKKKDAVLQKAYEYHPMNRRGMNVAGAVYTADARKYGLREKELRGEINDILIAANERSEYLDLHYFTQQDALRVLKDRLRQCDRDGPQRTKSHRRLSVVTGYGKNNAGKNVLKNAVIAYLKSQKYEYHQANMGEIVVTCK